MPILNEAEKYWKNAAAPIMGLPMDHLSNPNASDISQVFEMDDILVLSEAITALSGGDLKKKMGILSSTQSSLFLS
jgi:hypothetical protein